MLKPSGKHIHSTRFRLHANFLGGEVRWPCRRVGEHPRSNSRISEKDVATFRRFDTNVINTAEVTIRVVMYFVRCAGRIDINPGLQIEPQIRLKVLGFTNSLSDLHDSHAKIFEFWQALNIVGALPSLDIGVCDPLGVLFPQVIDPLQECSVKCATIIEKRAPDGSREDEIGNYFQVQRPF